jgi:hypothetical protein
MQRWIVDFHGVSVRRVSADELHYVRCVQGPPWTFPWEPWTRLSTEVWHDNIDGLDWRIVHSSATDNATQAGASALCENGTWDAHGDWRLPTMKEVVASQYYRLAGSTWFLAQWDQSWNGIRTATPRPGTTTFYRVDMWDGRVDINFAANQVLCVRNQPTGTSPPE